MGLQYEKVLYEAQPTVVETIEADDSTWAAIQEGMTRSCYNDRYGRGTSYGNMGQHPGQNLEHVRRGYRGGGQDRLPAARRWPG